MNRNKIIPKKNIFQKNKEAFRDYFTYYYENGFNYIVYPYRKNHVFKSKIRTKQEISKNALTEIEYKEYNIKIRRKYIPTSYDDIHSSICCNNKSWKKVSKRKKQWYK